MTNAMHAKCEKKTKTKIKNVSVSFLFSFSFSAWIFCFLVFFLLISNIDRKEFSTTTITTKNSCRVRITRITIHE